MLAQSFLAAADLGITEPQRGALQKVLVLLETGKLVHVRDPAVLPRQSHIPMDERVFSFQFNMAEWSNAHDCGTVCCIAGTAQMIGGFTFEYRYSQRGGRQLHTLFYPDDLPENIRYHDITPTQAARALRSYLTTGDAKWAEAVA